jgi:uncharacterized protein HemY
LGCRRGWRQGTLAQDRGDTPQAQAQALFQESLAIYRRLDVKPGVASALSQLGRLAWREGELPAARALLEEHLDLQRELGDQKAVAGALAQLGDLRIRAGLDQRTPDGPRAGRRLRP